MWDAWLGRKAPWISPRTPPRAAPPIDVTNCATTAQIQAYGAAHAYGMTVAASAFTVTTATCGHNVTVTLPFSLIYGYLTTNSFTLNSSACYPTNPA